MPDLAYIKPTKRSMKMSVRFKAIKTAILIWKPPSASTIDILYTEGLIISILEHISHIS